MQSCLSVCTRTKFRDYSWKGSCRKTFDEIAQENPDWQDILKIIETTRKTVLLLDNYLYVTGIPTNRKDKVGTAIRWSFLLQVKNVKDYFQPLVNAFETGAIKQLGSELDKICKVNNNYDVKDIVDGKVVKYEYEQFQAPDVDEFLKCLPDPEAAPQSAFKLWTDFVPEDDDKIQPLIDSLNLPKGEIIIYKDGEDKSYSSGKVVELKEIGSKKKSVKKTTGAISCLIFIGVGLAFWGLSEKPQSSVEKSLTQSTTYPETSPISPIHLEENLKDTQKMYNQTQSKQNQITPEQTQAPSNIQESNSTQQKSEMNQATAPQKQEDNQIANQEQTDKHNLKETQPEQMSNSQENVKESRNQQKNLTTPVEQGSKLQQINPKQQKKTSTTIKNQKKKVNPTQQKQQPHSQHTR